MNDQELDKLLDQWKAPETPPWLKTKVMQAVREEPVQEKNVFKLLLEKLALPQVGLAAACTVLVTLAVVAVTQPAEEATNVDIVGLEDALESFASFTSEESSWGEDPFL